MEKFKAKTKRKKIKRKGRKIHCKPSQTKPKSVPKLCLQVQNTVGNDISNRTIRRVLWKNEYNGRVPRKKPLNSETNRIKRLLFAKEHLSKNQDFWDQIIWSDEIKINLFGSDGCIRIWRKSNSDCKKKKTIPSIKHEGGSIMLWAFMSSSGVRNLHFIDGIMNKVIYKDILMQNLKQSAQKMEFQGSYTFQHNDPKHTAQFKTWLI